MPIKTTKPYFWLFIRISPSLKSMLDKSVSHAFFAGPSSMEGIVATILKTLSVG
jgi:hypothetical protein